MFIKRTLSRRIAEFVFFFFGLLVCLFFSNVNLSLISLKIISSFMH